MSRSVTLPDEVYRKAAELAKVERVSVDELVSAALAEQFAASDYLRRRTARASREKFLAALKQIPDVEPEEYDRL